MNPSLPDTDWKAGDIIIHTTDDFNGGSHGTAGVNFTSPSAGIVDITGGVWDARHIGRPNTWELLVGGVGVAAGSIPGEDYSLDGIDRDFPSTIFVDNVPVQQGSGIELRLTRLGDAGDFLGVNLDIAYDSAVVPIPPTLPLLGSALAALGFLRRRKA